MRLVLFFAALFPILAFAHNHHEDLKASPTLTGASLYQLDSTWRDQNNHSVKLSELQGEGKQEAQGRLVVMLYTGCQTSCPLIVEDLKGIAEELQILKLDRVQVSLFSLDSGRETTETLKAFALKRKLPQSWTLYTSQANEVAELAAALGIRYKRLQNGEFIHSNVIFFLNNRGEILARKEGLNSPRKNFVEQIQKSF